MIEKEVIEKLSEWATGAREAPNKVHLYPTNRCNLRCKFCYQQLSPYDYNDILSKEKWLNITEELCEMGVDIIRISGGGEPFLVPNKTLPMMKIVKEYGVTGRMTTNGTLFTDDQIKEVVDMGWDHMVFSVDGPNAKIHDSLRGVEGAFHKTIENIQKFSEIKKENGLELDDSPILEFSSVLARNNWRHVPETIRLAAEIGVKVITFEPLFVSNPNVKNLKMRKEDRVEFVEKADEWKELAESLNIFTNIDVVLDVSDVEKTGQLKDKIMDNKYDKEEETKNDFLDMPCFEPWLWPKIEANGDVGPCSTNLLDVNIKGKTFKEVWFGPEFEKFRDLIRNDNLPSGCENCVSTHIPLNREIKEKLKKRFRDEKQEK